MHVVSAAVRSTANALRIQVTARGIQEQGVLGDVFRVIILKHPLDREPPPRALKIHLPLAPPRVLGLVVAEKHRDFAPQSGRNNPHARLVHVPVEPIEVEHFLLLFGVGVNRRGFWDIVL